MKASRTVNNPWDFKNIHKRILQKNMNAHINVSFVLVLFSVFFYLEYCTVEVNLPYMLSPYIKSM